jgi:tetratricopeptide (TPR) repeat protein
MLSPNSRRALYVVCFGVMALLAILAASLASKPSTSQGATPTAEAPTPDPAWEQLMGLSVQARKTGQVQEAQRLLERAESLAATFGPHDMRRAHTRMGLAEFHLWGGRPQLAERAYREAVAIGEAARGPAHPDLISLLEGLVNFYFYRDRYDEAVPLFARILDIVRASSPRDTHEEARRLRNLAQAEQRRGHAAAATSGYLEALKLIEGSPQARPGELAEYLLAAAENHLVCGSPGLAKPLAARSLGLMETLAGPDALDVVPHLGTLAQANMETGEPARAVELYERVIAILERVSGPGHSDLAPFEAKLRHAQKMRP